MSRVRSGKCRPAAVLSASTERRHRPSAPEMSSGSAPTSAIGLARAATRRLSTQPPLWAPPTGPKKSWKRSIARPPARAVRAFSDTQEVALALSPEQQRAKDAFVRGRGGVWGAGGAGDGPPHGAPGRGKGGADARGSAGRRGQRSRSRSRLSYDGLSNCLIVRREKDHGSRDGIGTARIAAAPYRERA